MGNTCDSTLVVLAGGRGEEKGPRINEATAQEVHARARGEKNKNRTPHRQYRLGPVQIWVTRGGPRGLVKGARLQVWREQPIRQHRSGRSGSCSGSIGSSNSSSSCTVVVVVLLLVLGSYCSSSSRSSSSYCSYCSSSSSYILLYYSNYYCYYSNYYYYYYYYY
jgi:hypothetical protein